VPRDPRSICLLPAMSALFCSHHLSSQVVKPDFTKSMGSRSEAQLLRRGQTLRLSDMKETFAQRPFRRKPGDGAWMILDQDDVLLGGPYDRFARAVRWMIESAQVETITCLDLSQLEGADPQEIV